MTMMKIDGTLDNSPSVSPGTQRSEFGSQQMTTSGETAATAAAAQAEALVKARFAMAMHRPRDWMMVRQRLLDACKRPGFCGSARYRKPLGGGKFAEGWSIRFAEEAVRCMMNLHIPSMVIFDDSTKRIVQQTVTDLESNATYSADVTIEKTVERSSVREGQKVLGIRKNSYGKTVYLVEANEGDLVTKEAANMSKALRTLALRLLPGDIQDDCLAAYRATLSGDVQADRGTALKKLSDAFNGMGVPPKQLGEYLGHPIDDITEDEIIELRQVFSAIRDGETTWREAREAGERRAVNKRADEGEGSEPAKETRGQRVKEHVKKQAEKMQSAPVEDTDLVHTPAKDKAEKDTDNPWTNPKYKGVLGEASPDVDATENPGESQE